MFLKILLLNNCCVTFDMVCIVRFELTASRSQGGCSTKLSYMHIWLRVMVLPHSKSGNEPLESTLPPTRYLTVENSIIKCLGKRREEALRLITLIKFATLIRNLDMVVHKGFEPFSNPYKELALTNVLMDCFGKRYGTRTHKIGRAHV